MTLNELIESLHSFDMGAPLVFVTNLDEIGNGYHVTELKYAENTSIDCCANRSEWIEGSIQLLDGKVANS